MFHKNSKKSNLTRPIEPISLKSLAIVALKHLVHADDVGSGRRSFHIHLIIGR